MLIAHRALRALLALLLVAVATTPMVLAQEGSEVPVVAPGAEGLDGSSLKAFEAKYTQKLVMGENSQDAGHRTVSLVETNEGDGLKMTTTLIGQMMVSDEIEVARATFAPLSRKVDSPMVKRTEHFADGKVTGEKLAGQSAEPEPIDLKVDGARFDGGSLDLVLASLPLKEGYRARMPIFSSDFGPAMSNLWADISVQGKESLTVGGKTFDAWVVEKMILDPEQKRLEMQGQPMPPFMAWIISEPPYVVKMTMGPMQAELMAE